MYHENNYPTSDPASPAVDQLLGVNNEDVAVGFYADGQGNNHGYEYNIATHAFSTVSEAGVTSLTAAAINNLGDVAGAYVNPTTGNTDRFIKYSDGTFVDLTPTGACTTMALGVNDHDEVVGV